MDPREVIEVAGVVVEGLGVAVLVVGVVAVLVLHAVRRGTSLDDTRSALGRVLLLGLEILVAGDVISTVAVEPTFGSVGVLAVIVAVRTFLSWSITLETEGRWPWQRRLGEASRADGRTDVPPPAPTPAGEARR